MKCLMNWTVFTWTVMTVTALCKFALFQQLSHPFSQIVNMTYLHIYVEYHHNLSTEKISLTGLPFPTHNKPCLV